ncbi:hypothetical protein RDI58_022545 [Solanum bulbocastanum]|uniref:Uncharacterized protein n=1 Tax=Solanum bulbocastanum TaxID=147425 RepID=A0AAN8T7Y9_SOLBU
MDFVWWSEMSYRWLSCHSGIFYIRTTNAETINHLFLNCFKVTLIWCLFGRLSIPKVIHIYGEQNRLVDSLAAMATTM